MLGAIRKVYFCAKESLSRLLDDGQCIYASGEETLILTWPYNAGNMWDVDGNYSSVSKKYLFH